MDNDEYQRLVLLGLAEVVYMVGELVYGSPYKGLGGTYRRVAEELRAAAVTEVGNE